MTKGNSGIPPNHFGSTVSVENRGKSIQATEIMAAKIMELLKASFSNVKNKGLTFFAALEDQNDMETNLGGLIGGKISSDEGLIGRKT